MTSLDKLKVTLLSWDGDKDQPTFADWLDGYSDLIRSLQDGGDELELWLDAKLGRRINVRSGQPSFLLQDDDFKEAFAQFQGLQEAAQVNAGNATEATSTGETGVDPGDDDSTSQGGPASAVTGGSGASEQGSFLSSLPKASKPYHELSPEARNLDKRLFSILKTNIKGSKQALLKSVLFPSYVQGIIILSKHMDICRQDRKTRAFEAVERLQFTGDVQKFQVEAATTIRELFSAKCTIMDFALSRVMRAFDGKNKIVQHQIAHDINNKVINDDTPIYDLIAKYCSSIAATGDGKHHGVGSVDDRCNYCRQKGHTKDNCPKKSAAARKAASDSRPKGGGGGRGGGGGGRGRGRGGRGGGRGGGDKSHITCHKCQKKGHYANECPENKPVLNVEEAPVATPQPQPQPATQINSVQEGLRSLLTALNSRSGDIGMAQEQPRPQAQASPRAPAKTSSPKTKPSPPATSYEEDMQGIALSLCDGMACLYIALRFLDANISSYIGVENSEAAKIVAKNVEANLTSLLGDDFCSIDHSKWNSVFDITRQDIENLGTNKIKLLAFGAPCEDMSKLRLLPSSRKGWRKWWNKSGEDLRPGLDGPKGKVFRQCLQILSWALEFNPDLEYFIENIEFSDMPRDWYEVCEALGLPYVVNAADFSYTKRNRAYWTNMKIPENYFETHKSPKTDWHNCANPGRTIDTYMVSGREFVRPIGKSWRGDPFKPEADTSLPVFVHDVKFKEPQHLEPNEGELLMGMPENVTSGNSVSPRLRLRCIGNGWDLTVVDLFLRHSAIIPSPASKTSNFCDYEKKEKINSPTATVTQVLSEEHEALQALLVILFATNDEETFASLIAPFPEDEQLLFILLIDDWKFKNPDLILQSFQHYEGSVLDSGASRHLSSKTFVTDSESVIALTGFDHSKQWTQGMGYLPLTAHDEISNQQIQLDINEVDKINGLASEILSLGKLLRHGYEFYFTNYGKDCYGYTPGRSAKLRVELGLDDILRLPHKLREGVDSIPLPTTNDSASVMAVRRTLSELDAHFLHDLFNHSGMERIHRTIMVTQGYTTKRFHDHHCASCAVAKARRKGLSHSKNRSDRPKIASDRSDIKNVTFQDFSIPKVQDDFSATENSISGRPKKEIFNSDTSDTEKGNFQQINSVKVPSWLILGTAKLLGIPVDQELPNLVLTETDDTVAIYEDYEDDDDASLMEASYDLDFKAPVAGRALGIQPVPRFDILVIRPFEVMFCDNKDYDNFVRGGAKYAFVLICYKTRGKFKVDITTKKNNGTAFAKIVALNGIHKLPYSCTIYSDGCGSMALVESTAARFGINHQYIPPHEQSLNEAEKVCDQMWASARTHMVHTNCPEYLFAEALDYTFTVDLYMATTASRDWLTPYEMIKGSRPSVQHLRPFYTAATVTVPKAKRSQLKNKGLPFHRGEEGRLVGYRSPYSTTPRVLLEGNRLVHSINVTYDISSYTQPPVMEVPVTAEIVNDPSIEFSHPHASAPLDQHQPVQVDSELPQGSPYSPSQPHQLDDAFVQISPMGVPTPPVAQPEIYEWEAGDSPPWTTHAGSPQPRPRPGYIFLTEVAKLERSSANIDMYDQKFEKILLTLRAAEKGKPDVGAHLRAAEFLALHSQKDMDWKRELSNPKTRDSAIRSLEAELASLQSTILTRVKPDDPEYEQALELATTGRLILSKKRSGSAKCRGVKQGFKEDKLLADGPGFNYYSHVAKLDSVRMCLFRKGRGNRRLAMKDICVAYLQSNPYPDGMVKYVCFKHPVTLEWQYFRQSGPIYGEASSAVRWDLV